MLTEAEARRPGWPQLLANPNGGFFGDANPARATAGRSSSRRTARSRSRPSRSTSATASGHGPFAGQAMPGPNPIDQAAFNQLDHDGDGVLSPAELAAAEGLIRRLDVDEDEMVDLAELDPNRNPFAGVFFGNGGGRPGDPLGGPVVPLATPRPRSRAARRLLNRYDGSDSSAEGRAADPVESGLGVDAFRLADTDADGRLDAAELERFLATPIPSIVLVVRISKAPGQAPTIELAGPTKARRPSPRRSRRSQTGAWCSTWTAARSGSSANDSVRDFRRFFDMRFEEADADKDGFARPKGGGEGPVSWASSTPPIATATTSSPGPS